MGFIIAIIVGAFAGWLAGRIMNTNFSFIGNIAVGMIGGFVGNLVLGLIGIEGSGLIGSTIVSVVGACIFISIVRAIQKQGN